MAELKTDEETGVMAYNGHDDILRHAPVKPNFGRVVAHKIYRNEDVAEVRGLKRFIRHFRGGFCVNKERIGQEALDLIVRTGLATPENAKGVLHGLLTAEMCPDIPNLIYSFKTIGDDLSMETKYKWVTFDW